MEDKQQDVPASPTTEHLDVLARFLANDPRMIFPRRLREIRTQAGLTQQQLAGQVGIMLGATMHRSAIAKIESGERPVLLAEAVAFADILNVNLAALLRDARDIPDPDLTEARLEQMASAGRFAAASAREHEAEARLDAARNEREAAAEAMTAAQLKLQEIRRRHEAADDQEAGQ